MLNQNKLHEYARSFYLDINPVGDSGIFLFKRYRFWIENGTLILLKSNQKFICKVRVKSQYF